MTSPNDALLHARLNQETARIAWPELMPWFATGMVIAVSPDLDLIDVAMAVTRDDTTSVRNWMSSLQVAKVSDEQAREWLGQNVEVWAVVVKPWILVQVK